MNDFIMIHFGVTRTVHQYTLRLFQIGSFLLKLVEHVVTTQIKSHIDSNDLGNIFQSAYKSRHSTETAPLCIQNEIHLSLSKGMPTALVHLDLSAAFDTIDHDTLFLCLSTRFGFTGTVPGWFTSYRLDCFQSVKLPQ